MCVLLLKFVLSESFGRSVQRMRSSLPPVMRSFRAACSTLKTDSLRTIGTDKTWKYIDIAQVVKDGEIRRRIQVKNFPTPLEYCRAIEKSVDQLLINDWDGYTTSKRNTLLLSVSGGSDSMSMLHIMYEIQKKYRPDLNLEVVTFNHKTREETIEEVNLHLLLFKATESERRIVIDKVCLVFIHILYNY
jgi:hypothetical protein